MLTTQRLILRPMIKEDTRHLFELNSDPEVMKFTGDKACLSYSDAERIVTDLCQPQFQKYKMGRMTVTLHDGTYLGWCGLKYFENDVVDLGYRFLRRYWGQGYATESSKASLEYGFEQLKLKRIVARAMPANLASIKVIQKLNMKFKGLTIDPSVAAGFLLYDLTADEFKK